MMNAIPALMMGIADGKVRSGADLRQKRRSPGTRENSGRFSSELRPFPNGES
jgi:hypothetical protein